MQTKYNLLFCALVLLSCTFEPDPIEGNWVLMSQFYSANCRIIKDGKYFKGEVSHYDDGTSSYRFTADNPRYFFRKLRKDKCNYVDGTSGATTKQASANPLKIELLSDDSLKMTTTIMGQLLTELWIRNTKKNENN